MADVIRLESLSVGYDPAKPVLHDIDLRLPPSSFVAVIGPNGAGKSTLLKTISGLLAPLAGQIHIGELDLTSARAIERARRIAYLPQREAEEMPYTAFELVLMGRFPFQGFLPFDRAIDFEVAERCLELTGASELRNRLLLEMSGGERQKVHLSRALAQEPQVLLLDEPASSLDLRYQVSTYRLLSMLHREQRKTIIVVSHDLNLPAAYSELVVVLSEGGIAAVGNPLEVLRASVLEPIYGTPIIEASSPNHPLPLLFPVP